MKEVSCRMLAPLFHYVKSRRPQDLPALLEDLDEQLLTNEREWTSLQTTNLLYQRAEKIFGRSDVMFEIGRTTHRLPKWRLLFDALGLVPGPTMAFRLVLHSMKFFQRVADLRLTRLRRRTLEIEIRHRPGYVATRGACYLTQGIFSSLLKQKAGFSGRLTETHCAVPVWEKGIVGQKSYFLQAGCIWRRDLLSGATEEVGPPPADGRLTVDGTVYGTPTCRFRLDWQGAPGFLRWLLEDFLRRPRLLRRIQREMLSEFEVIEQQNNHLRRTNQALANLLEERTKLNQTLMVRVAEHTRELEQTVDQLKDLDQLKSNFLSLTSHELRTPLTIIKGALSLLVTEGGRLPAERYQKYLRMANESTDRLVHMIDELLDLTRLESGRFALNLKVLDLVALLQKLAQAHALDAEVHGLTLHVDLATGLPGLSGDEERLWQVFDHLLANAVKFTPRGGEISLTLRAEGNFAEVTVADTGVGISAEAQERIFAKFYQVDATLTRLTGGVGLGLTIARELVHLHGGLIWVHSAPGQGSAFFVRLPFSGPSADPPLLKNHLGAEAKPPEPRRGA